MLCSGEGHVPGVSADHCSADNELRGAGIGQ